MPELNQAQLWQLFFAGFCESTEGYNGEYVGPRLDGPEGTIRLGQRLLPSFEAALEEARRA